VSWPQSRKVGEKAWNLLPLILWCCETRLPSEVHPPTFPFSDRTNISWFPKKSGHWLFQLPHGTAGDTLTKISLECPKFCKILGRCSSRTVCHCQQLVL
jgi:hypothetical protein